MHLECNIYLKSKLCKIFFPQNVHFALKVYFILNVHALCTTSYFGRLVRRTSKKDQLDGSAGRISWMDQLDGPSYSTGFLYHYIMWTSCEKVMNNSWTSHKQVMKNQWTSHEQVRKKLRTSHEQVLNKSKLWTSNEQ